MKVYLQRLLPFTSFGKFWPLGSIMAGLYYWNEFFIILAPLFVKRKRDDVWRQILGWISTQNTIRYWLSISNSIHARCPREMLLIWILPWLLGSSWPAENNVSTRGQRISWKRIEQHRLYHQWGLKYFKSSMNLHLHISHLYSHLFTNGPTTGKKRTQSGNYRYFMIHVKYSWFSSSWSMRKKLEMPLLDSRLFSTTSSSGICDCLTYNNMSGVLEGNVVWWRTIVCTCPGVQSESLTRFWSARTDFQSPERERWK